jgi:hypothetical protein
MTTDGDRRREWLALLEAELARRAARVEWQAGEGDAPARGSGELGLADPISADQHRLAARLAPGQGPGAIDQRNPEGLRTLSALRSHYQRRA